MKTQFYDHLIEIKYLHEELETLDLSSSEKDELKQHVHSSIHYVALDIVLSELSLDHKKKFIEHLNAASHDELWKHLKENTKDIEEKLKTAIHQVAAEFQNEIKRIKSKA